jgi:3'-phosphoadenosine 5'-phosphosulfate sulfotransferase (PAPS reductase)/FAD synthetase
MSRRLVWISAGAASAVAAKLDIAHHPGAERVFAYTDPGSEHPDNERFLTDLETWLQASIERLASTKYADTWDVWAKRRYLNGPTGALCTAELKKLPRYAFEQPDDVQVFGYTVEEQHRADRFREQNPEVTLCTPLIDAGLTKDDCLAMIDRAGIELPAMYRLGYRNNNCIGCPKGGLGYWNKIRRDFPGVFDRMARLERDIGHTCSRDDDGAVWLDELDPERGNHADEPSFECSLLCAIAEAEVSA